MTLMAAGGRTSPPKAHLLQTRAVPQYAELMGRDLLSPHFGVSRHPSAPTMPAQRSKSDADAIRYTVRPMVARQRHQTSATGAGGGRQQTDSVPDATGQSRQDINESETRRGMFENRSTASHGVGTLLDWKPMTADKVGRGVNRIIASRHAIGPEDSPDAQVFSRGG
jgi:hypothetical protein